MAGPVSQRPGQPARPAANRPPARGQASPKGASKGASAAPSKVAPANAGKAARAPHGATQTAELRVGVGGPTISHGLGFVVASLILGGIMLIIAPGYMLLAVVGFLPVFALLIFETEWLWKHFVCLTTTNFAGVVLAFGYLWHGGGGVEIAFQLLRDPLIWLLMYGGAALGYGLAWSVPLLVQGLVELDALRRRTQIQKARTALQEEWSLNED